MIQRLRASVTIEDSGYEIGNVRAKWKAEENIYNISLYFKLDLLNETLVASQLVAHGAVYICM